MAVSAISELEYPPFSDGIFPCSRCHEGGGSATDASNRADFAHALHLEEGLGCEDCHMPDGGLDPAPAKVEFCIECHEDPKAGSEGVQKYFDRIRDAKGGYAIPSRWASDELVAHHPAHAKARISCEECHGKPIDGALVKPRSVALMTRCIACHKENSASGQSASGQSASGQSAPVDCKVCHTRILAPQHAAITLHHAEEQRDCFGCHDPADRDRLRLASGRTLPFENSYLLCGQCHGPKLRDWRDGLHGKRTGEWGGRRKYLLCVHCHTPHDPRIKPMHAEQRPPRPEEIR